MKFSPLNRRSAPQILRLCALCFKQGVLHAYELGDDYTAKEFLEQHKENWTYGVLGEPDDFDWKMWRFSLYRWCRYADLSNFAETYLYTVKTYNYLYCPIVMSMRFYLKGIEEWLDYPNPVQIERFKQESKVHWKPMPGAARKIIRQDLLADMQEIAYEYRRLPEDVRHLGEHVMTDFCAAMFDLTSKYVLKKKIRIDDTQIQNI